MFKLFIGLETPPNKEVKKRTLGWWQWGRRNEKSNHTLCGW
jgi:hypothetical protein